MNFYKDHTCGVMIRISEMGDRGANQGRARWRRLCLWGKIDLSRIRMVAVVAEPCVTEHVAFLFRVKSVCPAVRRSDKPPHTCESLALLSKYRRSKMDMHFESDTRVLRRYRAVD